MDKDKFVVPGRVHPSEYNWEEQFNRVAKIVMKTGDIYQTLDIGKVMGLCSYIKELESKLK